MIKMKVSEIKELLEDESVRDMISHASEVSGQMTGYWKKCTI